VFRQRERPFAFVRWLTHEEMEGEDGLQPTAVDLRNVTIMRRIPFVVPFLERVQIFQELLNQDKQDMNRMDEWGGALHHGDSIFLRVRRNYLYEDAFENLSPVNGKCSVVRFIHPLILYLSAPNIKKQIRVSMTNWAGLDEAGIDGGGIFR
jgi:ubiquitin-protein ligase E3 C